jgi:hypothetical protein
VCRMSRSRGEGLLRGVGRALRGLIRAWWTIDRVRVFPREGRLLGLQPPCVIFVRGQPVEIVGRHTLAPREPSEQLGNPGVCYVCQCETGPALLSVWPGSGNRFPQAVWQTDGKEQLLEEHQIEIYG